MPIDVILHKLDPTGINPDNLVPNEIIPITSTPIDGKDLITPKFGYFFTDSVVLKVNGVDVPRSQYKFTEYFHKASLKYGKQICGSILVDVTGLSGDYDLTYQALGGNTSRSASNIIDVYYDRLIPTEAVDWNNLRDRPLRFKPKPGHLHNQSEVYDLGRIISYIENIRDAIVLVEFPAYNQLMHYIDQMALVMSDNGSAFLSAHLPDLIDKFKAQFTKEYFGLDNLVNMACTTNQEGYNAGKQNYSYENINTDKYMTLSSLVMFKEALYEGIVDSISTNIGTKEQMFVSPIRKSLLEAPTGAIVSYIGQDTALTYDVPFSGDLYPVGTIGRKFLTSVKIATLDDGEVPANVADKRRGSLVVGYDHTAGGMWVGSHKTNDVADNFTWSQFLVDGTLQTLSLPVAEHIKDKGNSHKVTKSQIQLGFVENLVITPRDAIAQMRSERTYLTMDQAVDLMKLMEAQDFWMVDQEDDRNRFLLDNCQVVYSGCGNCGCDDRSDFQDATTCPPQGIIGYVCKKISADTYPANWPDEWDATDNTVVDPQTQYGNLWVIKADGKCGQYEEIVGEDNGDGHPRCEVTALMPDTPPVKIGEFCTRLEQWPPTGGYDPDYDVWTPTASTPGLGDGAYGRLIAVWRTSTGSEYTTVLSENSLTCPRPEIVNPPAPEVKISEYCQGPDRYAYYSNGTTSRYELVQKNAAGCTYYTAPYPARNTKATVKYICGSLQQDGVGMASDGLGGYYIAGSAGLVAAGLDWPKAGTVWVDGEYGVACVDPLHKTIAVGELITYGTALPDPSHLLFNNFRSIGTCKASKSSTNNRLHVAGDLSWGGVNSVFVTNYDTPKTRTFFLWQIPSKGKQGLVWSMASPDNSQSNNSFVFMNDALSDSDFNAPDLRLLRMVWTVE